MKALVLTKKGELPEYKEVDSPNANETSHIIDLRYSALNHRDVWITKGKYPRLKEGCILGSDGMGMFNDKRVLVNPGINWGNHQRHQSNKFEVLGMPSDGTFAEKIVVNKSLIHTVPKHLSDQEAAALPLGGVTAYRTVFSRCRLKSGENVLINGVGGGVAHFALLFAIAANANVYVTSGSDHKIDKARSLGAKEGVNYKSEHFSNQLKHLCPDGFDVIIDSAAGKSFKNMIEACAPGGRIGIYGGTLGKIEEVSPQILFWRQISILGSTMGSEKDFRDMLDFVAQHRIKPVIDDVIALSKYEKGFNRMDDYEQFGKIVFDNHA